MTTSVPDAMDEVRTSTENDRIDRLVDRLAEKVGGRANVKTVFGEPVERDGVSAIPVARVRWGFGFGSGMTPATVDKETAGAGSGTGMGGGAMADPIGYLEVGPDGAAFRPLRSPYLNPALIFATGVAVTLVVRALARLIRG